MKPTVRLFTVFLILMFTWKLAAEDSTNFTMTPKISAAVATNYYDKEMTVTGKVAQVTIRPTVTFLNLDKSHPKSPFTVVIFHQHSQFYGDANALKGKAIEIKGKIKNYNGKPEIVLDNTNQLTVIGVTNLEVFLKPKTSSASTNTPATNTPPRVIQATNLSEIM